MADWTTLVLSKQSMQLTLHAPVCRLNTEPVESAQKKLHHASVSKVTKEISHRELLLS